MRFAISAAIIALGLAACGGGPSGPDRRETGMYMEGLGGRGMMIRPGPSANTAYSDGIDLKKGGNCTAAIEKLRPVAGLGPGYENAQYALGECLVGMAASPETSQHMEGLVWLIRAADSGWTEANGKLAQIYAVGPASLRNLDEAAFRLALYRNGASLTRLGFTPLDGKVEAAVDNAVGNERLKIAMTRAAMWQPKAWVPPRSAAPEPGPEMSGRKRGPK